MFSDIRHSWRSETIRRVRTFAASRNRYEGCTHRRMAKKTRSSTKRDLVKSRSGKSFAKRTGKGRFKEMDGVKRSLASDRRKKAKRKVKSGRGDQGDR